MAVALFRILIFGEYEVEDAHGIDILQMVVPLAFGSLFANGGRCIVDAAVLEESLLRLLHLDNEFGMIFCLAIHVEN